MPIGYSGSERRRAVATRDPFALIASLALGAPSGAFAARAAAILRAAHP